MDDGKTEVGGREGTDVRGQRTEDRGHPSSPSATPWQGGLRSEGQEKDERPTSNEKQKKMKQRAEVEKLGCLEWINIRV